MKKALFLIFCVLRLTTYAQNEATNWYFGFNSGIKFNLANNTVSALSDGKLNTIEGCATISDDLGKIDEDFLPRMKSATAETRLSWLLCFDSKEAKE